MKRNLEKDLRRLYSVVPPMPDVNGKEVLMTQARNKKLALPTETSLLWFIRAQIHFISKRVLVFQFLLLCLYGFITTVMLKDNDGYLLLVPLAPIVVLLGTCELSRSYLYNMTELEVPSRFSLVQILLARFVITTVTDMLSLTAMLITTAMRTHYTFHSLIIYCLVPSFLAAAGSLFLLNRNRNANANYYILAYCISLSAMGATSLEVWPAWYDSAATMMWLLILVISAGFFTVELYKMLKNSAKQMGHVSLQ